MSEKSGRVKSETRKVMVTLPKDASVMLHFMMLDNNLFYNKASFIIFTMQSVLFKMKKHTVKLEDDDTDDVSEINDSEVGCFRNYVFSDQYMIKCYGRKDDKESILVIVPSGVLDGLSECIKSKYPDDEISLKDLARYSMMYYHDVMLLGGMRTRYTYSKAIDTIGKDAFDNEIKNIVPRPKEHIGSRGIITI